MTSRERLLKALDNKPVDRVPVTAYIDYMYVEYLKNSFEMDYISDCVNYQKEFRFDVILRSIPVPAEEIANEQTWHEEIERCSKNGTHETVYTMNTPGGILTRKDISYSRLPGELPAYAIVDNIIKTKSDFEIFVEYSPEVRVISLENIRKAREMVGESGIISVDIGGAFNAAVKLRGVQNLLIDAIDDYEFYKGQMLFQVEKIKRFIDDISAEKIDLVRHYDNEANGHLIGASFYEKYILAFERDIIMYAENKGLKVMLHNCGTMGELIKCYPKTGATAIESFLPPPMGDVDLQKAFSLLQDKMVRIGGIDQIYLLRQENKSLIRREVEKVVNTMKGNSGYIACTSDQLDREVPVENLAVYRDAAINSGKYTAL